MKAEKGGSGFGTLRQVLEIRVGQNHINKVKKKKKSNRRRIYFPLAVIYWQKRRNRTMLEEVATLDICQLVCLLFILDGSDFSSFV